MKKNILIVDDFEISRNLLDKLLTKAGCLVMSAEDGVDAQTYLDGRCFDLIITDLNMPNMDGIELVKAIRAHAIYRYIPVIMLSTKSNQDRPAIEAGVTVFIQKPFQVETLLASVKKIVRC
ncbi:response regulator [Xanthocytophaga agilis]|uniref:Response regulator n=1 Tax=Xanthocytophaga agilis TaxID=3048010 RepID=A0AAE3RDH0_9BACT|nr:response regulator [Xanthocytophaga agilis]MDJ1506635.1 response regulator [Xanthocytophaga agilis]